jgi:hypothetical protein
MGARRHGLTRPIDDITWRALRSAAGVWTRRGPRRGPGVVETAYDSYRTVIAAANTAPYGFSTHMSAYLTHQVDTVWHAWAGGQLMGSMVRWMCGSITHCYRLCDEPTGTICPMCVLAVSRRSPQPTVIITIEGRCQHG